MKVSRVKIGYLKKNQNNQPTNKTSKYSTGKKFKNYAKC